MAEPRRDELAHFFTSSVYFTGKDARALRWRGPREARALVARGERSVEGRGAGGPSRSRR